MEKYSRVQADDNRFAEGNGVGNGMLGEDGIEVLQMKDEKLKRQIRIFRFVSRIISTILSAFVVGSMTFSLQRFLSTRHVHVYGYGSIWAEPTSLWPTLMLLVIAVITFGINFSVLCSYCFGGIKAANTVSNYGGRFIYVMLAAEVIVWAITTGLYKMGNTGNDLWGWSCGSTSDEIQPLVQSFLDFGQLCMVQTGTFATTIIETVLYVLTFVTYLVVARRRMHKKKMKKELERRASSQVL